MISLLLSLLPFVFALAILIFRHQVRTCRALLLACGVVHTVVLSFGIALAPEAFQFSTVLGFQTPNPYLQKFALFAVSILFSCTALHALFWLPTAYRLEAHGAHPVHYLRESTFLACTAAFLGSMTLVTLAENVGLFWVAIEATTLFSAPLIGFHRSAESIEAMWKYILICSVGIGFALLGTLLTLYGAQIQMGHGVHLDLLSLKQAQFNPLWFKLGFVFILVGYGTKMGLAPFHAWLPDAHGESPAITSALLSGALLNCSFLGIAHFRKLAPLALGEFCDSLLIVLGLFSLLTAAVFIIRQHDYKRMLAYSSVENMGLLLILFAFHTPLTCLQLLSHSFLKMTLFLLAGNILLAYGTRRIHAVQGLLSSNLLLGRFWLFALLFIGATPPSPLFFCEIFIVREAHFAVSAIAMLLLFAVFCGLTHIATHMLTGKPNPHHPAPQSLPRSLFIVPSLGLILTFGLYVLFRYYQLPLVP